MLADDLKAVDEALVGHRDNVRCLRAALRFGILFDVPGAARIVAMEMHATARILESGGNQLELIPEKGDPEP